MPQARAATKKAAKKAAPARKRAQESDGKPRLSGNEDDGYDAECTVPRCEWSTRGWSTRTLASKRIQEHMDEHSSKEPMRELVEFTDENGV